MFSYKDLDLVENKNFWNKTGKKIILEEKMALESLYNQFENKNFFNTFSSVIQLLRMSKGRVIITGIGKSGHIGKKIAATFSSTGTPSFFVHAAEANHGDLGMIQNQDIVVALSWSGNTSELKNIVHYTKKQKIPLIAITSDENSLLAKEASYALLLPKRIEACPIQLAPTTSTILQLALGDALAGTLLKERQFNAENFYKFHPAGTLGKKLISVKEVMCAQEKLPLVLSGTNVKKAALILAEKNFGCVIVIDKNNELLGILTDGDLARNLHLDLSNLNVNEIMTTSPKTVSSNFLLKDVLPEMQYYKIRVIVVVEEKKPVGILHLHDILRFQSN